ncbi:uncharacterized protein LOC115227529, partial, partial [Argonauta hians]
MSSVVAPSPPHTAPAPPVAMWTKVTLSHPQLSRWLFFATPVQANGHLGFWSILGVLAGIGALIIGITYLLCRFKKTTNQVADQDRSLLTDTFGQRTEIRTVLYSLSPAEYHSMEPTPIVRQETQPETSLIPVAGPKPCTSSANSRMPLRRPQESKYWLDYGTNSLLNLIAPSVEDNTHDTPDTGISATNTTSSSSSSSS